MLFQKPKCRLTVRQGKRGAWRWTARSVGENRVWATTFEPDEVIAVCPVQGRDWMVYALQAGRAAMRGWNVVETIIKDYKENGNGDED